MAGQQAGTAVTAIQGGTVTVAEAADAFLSSPRAASPNTRRAYAGVLDRLAAELGPGRQLAAVPGDEIAAALRRLWGEPRPGDVEPQPGRRRVLADLVRRRRNGGRPRSCPPTPSGARSTATPPGHCPAAASRGCCPAATSRCGRRRCGGCYTRPPPAPARSSRLNVEDLDLEQRRAAVRSKGGDTEFVYWDTGTAHLLPRLLRLPDGTSRTSGPLFLASRRPVPARRPVQRDICPHTGRGRLGYDRARVLFRKYTARTVAWSSTSFATPRRPTSVTRRSRCS